MSGDAEDFDTRWMTLALRRAASGTGATYPNPSVGAAVIARGQGSGPELVGLARSAPTGGPHAEVRALAQAGPRARGATVYVTLEPCSHVGRTPPCVDALIAAGVAEVVIGARDPAPHASGRGLDRLREAGVRVREGVLRDRAESVHAHYLHHVRVGAPYVTLKAATSLDGRIAAPTGDSRWITGEASRRRGHRLRARHHAIAVGVGTVLADDPELTVRWVRGVDPEPVIFDSRLRVADVDRPLRLLRPGTRVLHGPDVRARAIEAVSATGARPIAVDVDPRGRIDVVAALAVLGREPIRSLLVEGGGQLLASFVAAGAWQRLYLFQAPRLLGDGLPVLPGLSWPTVAQAPHLRVVRRRRLGDDLLTVLAPDRAPGSLVP
ncbi:MAG: bifunctional diaminohydroxyphosphoribosylaminopyrimidine deaminase/5-amino-6-(5-phosphoribosylamino)uracil reductase RibD [Nannocystaceae bacterium]